MSTNLPQAILDAGAYGTIIDPESVVAKTSFENNGKCNVKQVMTKYEKAIENMRPRLRAELGDFPPKLQEGAIDFASGEISHNQMVDHVLRYHPAVARMFGFNLLTNTIVRKNEIPDLNSKFGSGKKKCKIIDVQEEDYALLEVWLETLGIIGTSKHLKAFITKISKERSYNPIVNYLRRAEKKWDGQGRLATFFSTVFRLEKSAYYREIGTRFMVAAVARAMVVDKPYKFDWLPVLSGGQGLGKSLFCRTLFGEYIKEGLPANLDHKDAKQELWGVWAVELSELSSFRRTDNNTIKDYLSREEDRFRKSYGHNVETFYRHNVFVGTTNDAEFLTDTTGNRRFMPIFLEEEIDLEWLDKNRDQLWGEAYSIYRNNPEYPTYIPSEIQEEVNAMHERARVHDMIEEKILDFLEHDNYLNDHEGRGFTSADLASYIGLPSNGSTNKRIGAILTRLGYTSHQTRIGGMRRQLWRNPREEDILQEDG